MQIIKVKWTSAEHDMLRVSLDDGTKLFVPWPCQTWHRVHIEEFLKTTGVEAEDPPPAPIDLSDLDNLEKTIKAIGLTIAALTGKTPAQVKAAFKTAWQSLP